MTIQGELMDLFATSPFPTMRATLPIPNGLKTPYKLERLVVGPSNKRSVFDEKAADVTFDFRHQNRFYLTYVGYDGIGYQTGLVSSRDLRNWRKEGVILPRDRKSKIVRYNAALTWILRENDVFGPGKLKKLNGRYLGTYFATPYSGYESAPESLASAGAGICVIGKSSRPACFHRTEWGGKRPASTKPASWKTSASITFFTMRKTGQKAGVNKPAWRHHAT